MIDVGDFLGSGGTSDIYRLGNDAVIKIPRPGVPPHWAALEADLTSTVHAIGLPVPRPRDLIRVDDKDCVVLDYIDGPSMWTRMLGSPGHVSALAEQLAAIQHSIATTEAPPGIPQLHDRIAVKINEVPRLSAANRSAALDLLADLPRADTLYHGDLHPGNVLMSPDGPIVIDWFDAAAGSPVADAVRSSLLTRSSSDPRLVAPHLPGAKPALLEKVNAAFVQASTPILEAERSHVAAWEALQALARLAEDAELDESGLQEIWDSRGRCASSLVSTLERLRTDRACPPSSSNLA